MLATSDPNLIIGGLALAGLLLACLWYLIAWVRNAPVKPDPWDAAVDQKLAEPETPESCTHCSTPQPPGTWFCPHCGCATGTYNNVMPFLYLFSEGEVWRNGVHNRIQARPLIIIGYLLYSLASMAFFAPIYWVFLFRNLRQDKSMDLPQVPSASD